MTPRKQELQDGIEDHIRTVLLLDLQYMVEKMISLHLMYTITIILAKTPYNHDKDQGYNIVL